MATHTDYEIVFGKTPGEVEGRVNQALSLGWRLVGGISVAFVPESAKYPRSESEYLYAQAIAKESDLS